MRLEKWRAIKPDTMFRIYVDAEHEKSGPAGQRRLMAEAFIDKVYPHPCTVAVLTSLPADNAKRSNGGFTRGVPHIVVQVHLPDTVEYNEDDPPAARVLGHWLPEDERSQELREGLPS